MNDFIQSAVLKSLKPFGEFAFADTPLAAELESGQLFPLRHEQHGSLGHLQRVSDLFDGQKTQRSNLVFHFGVGYGRWAAQELSTFKRVAISRPMPMMIIAPMNFSVLRTS